MVSIGQSSANLNSQGRWVTGITAPMPYWRHTETETRVAANKASIQIQHGAADKKFPVKVGQRFADELQTAVVSHEHFIYPGENHNINGPSFGIAMQRVVDFFDNNR